MGQGRRMKNGLQVCRMSLDDMAEREMAKRKSSSSSKYSSASQKEFEDLVKAIPDPAEEQDGLLADGACVLLHLHHHHTMLRYQR